MSERYLLDANVLIALTISDHEHHERARAWAASASVLAVSPIVEGALVRFLVRLGESAATAQAVLEALEAARGVEFWPEALSFRGVDLTHVVGHRQVTDAYLATLAAERGGRLATFDVGLARELPGSVVLIP